MSLKTGRSERVARETIIQRWKLVSPEVVSAPGDTRFINPLRLGDVGEAIFRKWKLQQHVLAALAMVCSSVLLVWALVGVGNDIRLGLGMSMLTTFLVMNDLSAASADDLAERSEFLWAVISNANGPTWVVIAMSLLALASSGFFVGSFEDAAYATGAIISDVLAGEVWRVVTGSFVHHTIQHWIINCVMLAFIFPLSAFYSLRDALLCFVAGTLASQLLYIALGALGWHQGDVLVGFSGGVYALMGYLLMDSCLIREKYPRRFFVLVLGFCFLVLAGTSLLNPNASLIAHVSGFLSGIVIFAIVWRFQRDGGRGGRKRRPLSGGCH